jgi:hypothetical protein
VVITGCFGCNSLSRTGHGSARSGRRSGPPTRPASECARRPDETWFRRARRRRSAGARSPAPPRNGNGRSGCAGAHFGEKPLRVERSAGPAAAPARRRNGRAPAPFAFSSCSRTIRPRGTPVFREVSRNHSASSSCNRTVIVLLICFESNARRLMEPDGGLAGLGLANAGSRNWVSSE